MRLGADPMDTTAETLELLRRPGFDQRRWDAGPKTVDRFIACGGMRRTQAAPIARPIFTERRRAARFWRRWGVAIALVLLFAFHFLTRGPQ